MGPNTVFLSRTPTINILQTTKVRGAVCKLVLKKLSKYANGLNPEYQKWNGTNYMFHGTLKHPMDILK